MSQGNPTTRAASLPRRFARAALWPLFAAILLIPNLIALRRRPRAWNAVRVILAATGAALIAAEVASRAGAASAALGAALLLLALVAGPERARRSLDERARQLGALVVVNGGAYQPPHAAPVKAHLCVGPDRVWILDAALATKLELPLASVNSLQALPAGAGWKLSFLSADSVADLLYSGPFAEHFARVAESTVRSQLHRELPILR